jgi:K+-transporting ATPase ATPase C chain
LGVIYPLFVYGVGQLFFREKANGSLFVYHDGKVIGSECIGQNFLKPEYFHPRPSSAGANGYDAAHSSGSNFGPTSQKLTDAMKQRVSAYRSENKLGIDVIIPMDAVTSSGSGLDPHIGIANALLQVSRIAAARNLPEQKVKDLIKEYKEGPTWGLFGEARVNVLKVNLALDKMSATKGST